MSEYLSGKPRIVIVSDTSMWVKGNSIVAFEPVVREIEHFFTLFDHITWIGYQRSNQSIDANTREVAAHVPIRFVPLKAVGGPSLWDKLKILLVAPYYALVVWRHIRRADVVHTRAPSLPAFWAICFSFLDGRRVYWHKYAGNWQEPKPPVFYGLQRSLLKKAKHTKVTINGRWPNQQAHLLSFENPCLTNVEMQEAATIGNTKNFEGPLTLAFVGNLTPNKGIITLLQAIVLMKHPQGIARVLIAGDGVLRTEVESMSPSLPVEVEVLGFLQRSQLKSVYAAAHLICLPSHSEGFPKVIAEGAAFGCIPMVSDVSAIGQYVHQQENGYLIPEINPAAIAQVLDEVLEQHASLKDVSTKAMEMARLFTYDRFTARINREIINSTQL